MASRLDTRIRALAAVARECGITRLRVADVEIEIGELPTAQASHAETPAGVTRDDILFGSGAGRRMRLPV